MLLRLGGRTSIHEEWAKARIWHSTVVRLNDLETQEEVHLVRIDLSNQKGLRIVSEHPESK